MLREILGLPEKCRCNSNEIVQHEKQRTTAVVLYKKSNVSTMSVEVQSILFCFIKRRSKVFVIIEGLLPQVFIMYARVGA